MEAEGKAVNMTKTQTVWPVGSMNVTGAQMLGDGPDLACCDDAHGAIFEAL